MPDVPYGVALERDGHPLLTPFCPPRFESMEAAVGAVVDLKYGDSGIFRGGSRHSSWKRPDTISRSVAGPDAKAIEAAVAYCTYVYRRYGRFPAYPPPFRTVLGFQANHLDLEFYTRHYKSEAVGERQRRHMERWHR